MVSIDATLEPQGKLDPEPWLTGPDTRAVVAALTADGANVRFVGGCVRDGLAKRPVKDIDIATTARPETVIGLLQKAGLKAIPTGIDHGTVTAVAGATPFEVTTLRVDLETDGRHARVAFTDDWVEDAKRRDFTINAMSASPDGDVYDYFYGIPDLAHGTIRFVGLAHERVEEDYLRILRYFRFYAHHGRPPPDRDALAACRRYADKLETLSAERLREETLRILAAPDPAEVVLLMRGHGVLDHLLPEAGDVGRLRMAVWLATRAVNIEGVGPDPLRRLAALLDPATDADGAAAMAARFRLSNRDTDRLVAMAAPAAAVDATMDEARQRRLLHRFGAEPLTDLVVLTWAGELALTPKLPSERTQGWIALLEAAAGWTGAELPLKGRDVLDLGVAPGPAVGRLLDEVEAWWEDGDYRATRDECLARLAQAAAAQRGQGEDAT